MDFFIPFTSVMPGKVEKEVVNWFYQYFPDWWDSWIDPEFDAFKELPVELKMVPAFRTMEHDMINGGWPQFLWNSFFNWCELIEIVREGYALIDAAPEVINALDELSMRCKENEAECEEELYADDWRFSDFMQSMTNKYKDEKSSWEMLLWSSTAQYWQRLSWLDQNEVRIKRLMKKFTPE